MSKKMDRKPHEPGWGEVILGAALSVVIGVVLGAVALVFKPVETVKELPKEPVPGQTYFIEGSRDSSKAKQATAKRKAFALGSSGTLSIVEDELNSLAGPATPAPVPAAKPKAGDKAAPAAPSAPSGDALSAGTPNFRIRGGVVQIGFPVTIGLLDTKVVVQAQGMFAKRGNVFVFEPETLTVGSCPVQRLPYASTYVTKKFLASQTVAEDIAAAWPKVSAIAVEGNVLKLTMP
ncbi:MAG: hypothetical protein NTV51_29215 [Verrucomicrobia bacterium]|nr:hypothetical protein [Verrucomicrobiota bacterium]